MVGLGAAVLLVAYVDVGLGIGVGSVGGLLAGVGLTVAKTTDYSETTVRDGIMAPLRWRWLSGRLPLTRDGAATTIARQ